MCLEKHLIVVHLTKSKLKKRKGVNHVIILDTAVKLAGWNRKRPKGMRLSQTQLPRSRRTNPFQCMLKWRKAASIYVSHACWRDSPFQYRWESEGLKGCPNFPEKKRILAVKHGAPQSKSKVVSSRLQRNLNNMMKSEEIWWILVSANSISRLSNKWALFNPANYSHLPSKSFSYGLTTLAHTFAILQWCIPHTRATPRWNMMAHERFEPILRYFDPHNNMGIPWLLDNCRNALAWCLALEISGLDLEDGNMRNTGPWICYNMMTRPGLPLSKKLYLHQLIRIYIYMYSNISI